MISLKRVREINIKENDKKNVCFFDNDRTRFPLSEIISEDKSEINIYDYLGYFALDQNTCFFG